MQTFHVERRSTQTVRTEKESNSMHYNITTCKFKVRLRPVSLGGDAFWVDGAQQVGPVFSAVRAQVDDRQIQVDERRKV